MGEIRDFKFGNIKHVVYVNYVSILYAPRAHRAFTAERILPARRFASAILQ